MYVNPNTTIYILKNIPLNKSYENTVYYKNADAQRDAFMKYTKYKLTNYSYQRTALGTLKVELKYEQLYDCDYLMFQNTSFVDDDGKAKWFYAFITGVSYISDEVSQISYELDVMQTWCYDYSFLPSFVARRHATKDDLYGNTQPEGLELGNCYKIAKSKTVPFDTYYVIMSSESPKSSYDASKISFYPAGATINKIYNGLIVAITKEKNDATGINSYLSALIKDGYEDTVVAFYQSPSSGNDIVTGSFTPSDKPYHFIPKNNKLYCYPFRKFTVTSNRGMAKDYKPERWHPDVTVTTPTRTTPINFIIREVCFPEAQARFEASDYMDGNTSQDNGIIYGNFPTCSFIGSTFSVWLAQNKNNYIASMNAIGSTFDTNMQIAQNNYEMAQRSANASAMMASNSIDTQLGNARANYETSSDVLRRGTQRSIVRDTATGVASALGFNFSGSAQSAMNAIQATASMGDQQQMLDTGLNNAMNSAGSAMQIAGIAQETALRNASTSQASAILSALTAKANATNALVSKKQDIQNYPNTAKGNATADGIAWNAGAGFVIMECTINDEYAEIIDNYFTCYGYAQNELYNSDQLNQRINRNHFTFTKTVGCAITGDLNSNDQIAIQSIYDNGIETWDTLENVGHFELDNSTL